MDIGALNDSVMRAFAEVAPVVYRSQHQESPIIVRGIYDRFAIEVQLENGLSKTELKAVLQVSLDDFQKHGLMPEANDGVEIQARAGMPAILFDIMDAQPDGLGWYVLSLSFRKQIGP